MRTDQAGNETFDSAFVSQNPKRPRDELNKYHKPLAIFDSIGKTLA
jgi:hypothetical protein